MATLGQFNHLKIINKSSRATLLEGGNLGQIYLSASQTPSHCEVGDRIAVFLYQDNHDQTVATTQKPRIEVGGVACLKVVSVNTIGAFLDWGLPKDLFVPFAQQAERMAVGEFHLVYAYLDNTGRICGSSKLNRVITTETSGLKTGDAVNLIVGSLTDLGYKTIVNQKFWGLLHHDEVFRELRYGQQLKGFVKNLRGDKKIDITLKKPGFSRNLSLAEKILEAIEKAGGFAKINDKTSPEEIYRAFGVSKKVFKAELGALYKQRKIVIERDGIRLAE